MSDATTNRRDVVRHPADWSTSDTLLERMLAAEDRAVLLNRRLLWLSFVLLGLIAVALALGVLALNRDIETVARATPKDASVGQAAIRAGAVTEDKLADAAVTGRALAIGAVTEDRIADGAVTTRTLARAAVTAEQLTDDAVTARALADGSVGATAVAAGAVTASGLADSAVTARTLAPGAVTTTALAARSVTNGVLADRSVGPAKLRRRAITAALVAPNALTGATIDESTLGQVPRAAVAGDAEALDGRSAASFLTRIRVVQEAGRIGDADAKSVDAACPAGARAIGGGGWVEGTTEGVGLVESRPAGSDAWHVAARAFGIPSGPWRLVATAVCASGGA